jgi:hypothetical protein
MYARRRISAPRLGDMMPSVTQASTALLKSSHREPLELGTPGAAPLPVHAAAALAAMLQAPAWGEATCGDATGSSPGVWPPTRAS